MKKIVAVFVSIAALSSVFAFAENTTDYKKCYKRCMDKINDAQKCDYICDDKQQ